MDSVDLEVLRSATSWFKAGHTVVLATVVKTWGSAPRPIGAMLAIRGDGRVSGSVSGGCVEGDLIDRVHAHKLACDKPEVATYGVSKEPADRFHLPCGGTLQLVLEPVKASARLDDLLGAIGRQELVGLQIGSRTPPEIAVAILAEMTAVRRGVLIPQTIEPPKAGIEAGCGVPRT